MLAYIPAPWILWDITSMVIFHSKFLQVTRKNQREDPQGKLVPHQVSPKNAITKKLKKKKPGPEKTLSINDKWKNDHKYNIPMEKYKYNH